ncbi:hypothetical protein FBU30_009650 [Linnemannia zychae]|nr:hypothetical protein FBU30_009650 [Linnemannia zychae]
MSANVSQQNRGNYGPMGGLLSTNVADHPDSAPPPYSASPEVHVNREWSPLLGSSRNPGHQRPSGAAACWIAFLEAIRRQTFVQRCRDWTSHKVWLVDNWLKDHAVHIFTAVVGSLVLGCIVVAIIHEANECKVPENAEETIISYSYDPADFRDFFFHLDEGISGDIYVSQSRDRVESNVTIHISAKGNTHDMLSAISFKTNPNHRGGILETKIHLDMTPSEISAALSKNCTRVEVDIIFPRHMIEYNLIQLESRYKGDVRLRLENTVNVERVEILAKSGSVQVRDVVVTDEMNIVAKRGRVETQSVEIQNAIRVNAKSDVSLELISYTYSMNAKVFTGGNAQVRLRNQFWGHFSLTTTSDNPPQLVSVQYGYNEQERTNNTLKGFMSYSGYEPGYLPRVDIRGLTARLEF